MLGIWPCSPDFETMDPDLSAGTMLWVIPGSSDSSPEECHGGTEEVSQETTEEISLSFTTWRTQGCEPRALSLFLFDEVVDSDLLRSPQELGNLFLKTSRPLPMGAEGLSKEEREGCHRSPLSSCGWVWWAAHLQLLLPEGGRGQQCCF